MPVQTKIFRIFVSSTFSDMRVERGILQSKVFKRLDELCTQSGAQFQAVDLRWGVNEESQLDQRTMDICLGEIERCQKMSPKPNFLVLLGDRYGWQPLPARIPASEMEQIETQLIGEDLVLLQKWYLRDDNSAPPEYLLQPRKEEHKNYKDWQPIEDRLRTLLRQSVKSLKFSEDKRVKYFTSATHQEILHGALGSHLDGAKEHVTAFVRKIDGLPHDSTAEDFLDLVDGTVDPHAQTQLGILRGQLKDYLGNACHDYRAKWNSGTIELEDDQAFADDVYSHFENIIKNELAEIQSPNEVDHERKLQKAFRLRLIHGFQGRETELTHIESYLESPKGKILALVGASGSGKSSVIAQAITRANEQYKRVVYRFLGTTSRSSTFEGLVTSLCAEICERYGTTHEDLFCMDIEDNKRIERLKLMQTDSGLKDLFTLCLGLADTAKPLVLFLDALDQFENPQRVLSLLSRVQTLPPSVALVVSCLPELESKLHYARVQSLPVLERKTGEVILSGWLSEANRCLMPHQMQIVLEAFQVEGLPIFLKLAFELSRRWASYTPVERLPTSVSGILEQFFRSLEGAHTEITVQKALGYMLCGRYGGLTEREITTMLVRDEEHWSAFLKRTHETHRKEVKDMGKLPDVVWSRLYLDLEPYLTERNVAGVPVLCFFHRQFWEVARGRFVAGDERKLKLHLGLGNMFLKQKLFLDSESLREIPNTRKCVEAPFQLMTSEMWMELTETVCDIFFVEAVAKAELLDGLQGDYASTLKTIPLGEDRDCIGDFQYLFMRQKHVLMRYPQIVFQQLYNELQWKKGRLKEWAEMARDAFMKVGGKFLHQYREPKIEKSHLVMTLVGRCGWANCCMFSPDGNRIVSGGVDKTLRIWDAETGQELSTLTGHGDGVKCCAYSSDGSYIVSGGVDKTLRIWDAETGQELSTLTGHSEIIHCCSYSPDGRRIVSGSMDKTLKIWDAETGQELSTLTGHGDGVKCCAYSSDGSYIVSGGVDKTLRIWDAETGQELSTLTGHSEIIHCCSYSPDGRRIVSGSMDKTLKIWDAETGCEVLPLISHRYSVSCCMYSPDGSCIVSGSVDKTLKIWDAETGRELTTLTGHRGPVNCCSYSSDGSRIVSGSMDKTLIIWDTETSREIANFAGHSWDVNYCVYSPDGSHIMSMSWFELKTWDAESGRELMTFARNNGSLHCLTCCAYSPDGSRIVSGSHDKTLKIWDVETGREHAILTGHSDSVRCCVYSPDGGHIVTGSDDSVLKVWNAITGRELMTLRGHRGSVNYCVYSPDGSHIMSLSEFEMKIWDAETGRELASLFGGNIIPRCCAYYPDPGRLTVRMSLDYNLQVWDVATTNQVLTNLVGHSDYVACYAFSPDGSRIVSGSHDTTLKVWDTFTGRELMTLRGHSGSVNYCTYTNDSRRIMSWSGIELKVWDAETGLLLSSYSCQNGVKSFVFSPCGSIIVCGDESGNLNLFKLEGLETGSGNHPLPTKDTL